MSRTVCSWCKAPLVLKDDILVCSNTDCPACDEKYLHEELIRTRKALDVAVDALKEIDKTRSIDNHKIGTQDKTLNPGIVFCWTTPDEIHNALAEITALEQKE